MPIPILILFFNRKSSIIQLVESLQKVRPNILYLACDGARDTDESVAIEDIRQIVLNKINWDCKVETRFLDYNLGCKLAVHGAVQWFFENVEHGIVLEDDCIPSPAFFEYVEDMLTFYRDDNRIATIAGRREVCDKPHGKITFSSKFFCWGWASWADRIRGIDVEFGYQKSLPSNIFLEKSFLEKQHIKGIHNLMLTNMVNSWAYSYDLFFRFRDQLHIIPPNNYISNVGIGDGTHKTPKKADLLTANDFYKANCKKVNVRKDNEYMSSYFREVYSPLKILLFPFIGNIKFLLKKIGL